MSLMKLKLIFVSMILVTSTAVLAGPVDPDCNATKAARSTAMKATVGVGGRCSPAEAAKDMGKDAVGMEDKGVIEQKRDKQGPAGKVKDKVS